MTDGAEKWDHAQIEVIRNELLDIMVAKLRDGVDPEHVATAAVAAGATIYGIMMGGIKKGREEEARRLFGGWIVDNIIAMNNAEWPAEVKRPHGITPAGMRFLRDKKGGT